VYVHCTGHILNLCLVDVSSRVQSVRNNFGIVSSLYNLIQGSAKRHKLSEDIQIEAGLKCLSVKQLCETRWTCRWECLKVILQRYSQIIETLQVMDGPEAFLLSNSLNTFDFIFHLLIMSEVYLITNIMSKFLQNSNISLTQALIQAKMTVETLKAFRTDSEFERFYEISMKMCEENDIDPPKESRKKKVSSALLSLYSFSSLRNICVL